MGRSDAAGARRRVSSRSPDADRGEVPGDREDIDGKPFVGPAGRVLDGGLERAGIPRDEVFLTNVVKHFRYKTRGKRRIHQRPDRWQVKACLPWLSAELAIVKPAAVVCLGHRSSGSARLADPDRP